jgi:DNA replication protein DnaC
MLIQPTLDTLNRLKLHGMALGLSEQMTNSAAQQLGFEERVALLLEREVLHRENRRMGRLLKQAQLKDRTAVMEGIDYRSRSGLDRPQLASLTSCDWIRSNQSLLIHGATGSGKTYLACALAHQACRAGLSAWYVRAPRLFEELNLCHADGTFLDDRVGNSASILASQLPVDHWHEYLSDPTLADAILDRLVHSSHRIHLQGKESIRKRYAAKAAKNGAQD